MSVCQPLNVLQISLVVATRSGSTFTPRPNESGSGGSGRLMALNEIMELVVRGGHADADVTPAGDRVVIDGHVVGPEQQHGR